MKNEELPCGVMSKHYMLHSDSSFFILNSSLKPWIYSTIPDWKHQK